MASEVDERVEYEETSTAILAAVSADSPEPVSQEAPTTSHMYAAAAATGSGSHQAATSDEPNDASSIPDAQLPAALVDAPSNELISLPELATPEPTQNSANHDTLSPAANEQHAAATAQAVEYSKDLDNTACLADPGQSQSDAPVTSSVVTTPILDGTLEGPSAATAASKVAETLLLQPSSPSLLPPPPQREQQQDQEQVSDVEAPTEATHELVEEQQGCVTDTERALSDADKCPVAMHVGSPPLAAGADALEEGVDSMLLPAATHPPSLLGTSAAEEADGAEAEGAAASSPQQGATTKEAVALPSQPSQQAYIADLKVETSMDPQPCHSPSGALLQGTMRYRLTTPEPHFTTRHGRSLALEDMQRSVDRLHNPTQSMPCTPAGSPQLLTARHNPSKMLTKSLSLDQEAAMVGRLYTPKAKAPKPPPIKAVKLAFAGADKGQQESWVPIKRSTNDERTSAMCELYQRCIDSRAKTEAELAAKYLQPLGRSKTLGEKYLDGSCRVE